MNFLRISDLKKKNRGTLNARNSSPPTYELNRCMQIDVRGEKRGRSFPIPGATRKITSPRVRQQWFCSKTIVYVSVSTSRGNKFLSQRRCSLTCLVTRLHTAKCAAKCARVFWHFAILDGIIILHVCVFTSPTSRNLLFAIPDNSLMDRAACKSRRQGFKVERETTHEPHTIDSIVLLLDDAKCSINYSETMRDDPGGPPVPASLLPSFNVLSRRSTARCFFLLRFIDGKRLGTSRKSSFGGGFVDSTR